MKIIQFIICFLLAVFLCGFGCSSSKPTPDPLTGWHFEDHNPDQTIEKDYQDYIQKLSPEERKYIGTVHFFGDGTGQHAISIEIFVSDRNASWQHALIYDKDDKRIKVIKYGYRRYES